MAAIGPFRALAFACLALLAIGRGSNAEEPARGTPEFRGIVSATGKFIEKDVGPAVGLVIRRIDIEGEWGYLNATIVQRSGAPLDWSQTRYAAAWASKSVSDQVMALLRREADQWRVVEYAFGPTTPVWQVWLARHQVPRGLFVAGAPVETAAPPKPKPETPKPQPPPVAAAPPVTPPQTQPAAPPAPQAQPQPPASAVASAQPKPAPPMALPQSVAATPPTVPVPKFKRTDPCDPASQAPRGAPWAAPTGKAVQVEGEPVSVPQADLDIGQFSPDQIKAAVAAAKQQLLIVYGGLSEDAMAAFETAWAPLEEYPAPETAQYLNALNPLLTRFITTRTAFERTAAILQGVLLDSAIAVQAGDETVLRAARDEALRLRNELSALQRALATIGAEIERLGNPPNPMPRACKAHKRGQPPREGGKTFFDAIMDEPWMMVSVFSGPTHALVPSSTMMSYNKRTKVADGDSITLVDEVYGFGKPTCGIMNPQVHFGTDTLPLRRSTIDMRFSPDRRRIEELSARIEEQICKTSGLINRDQKIWQFSDGGVQVHSDIRLRNVPADQIRLKQQPDGKGQALQIVIEGDSARPLIQNASSSGYWTETFASKYLDIFERDARRPSGDRIVISTGRGLDTYSSSMLLSAGFWASTVADARLADGTRLADAGKAHAQKSTPVKPLPPDIGAQSADDSAAKAAAQKALNEEIAYQKSLIEIISRNLQREIADLQAAQGNPKSGDDLIRDLQFRVIHQASNLTEERDRLTSLTTGVVVKSRTAFDEYASTLFRQTVEIKAREADQKLKLARGAERLANLAPPEERETLKAQIAQTLKPASVVRLSVGEVRRATRAIQEQVAGHWQKRAAEADIEAVDAMENQFYASLVSATAGMVAIGLSGPAFAQAFGAEAAAVVWAPTITGTLYGGTTGGIEGGPVGAIRGAVSWSSQIGYFGVTAYDGYFGGPDGEKPGGLVGAVKNVGMAAAIGKVMTIGVGIAAMGANAVIRRATGASKPMLAEWHEMERFNREVALGQQALHEYEAAEKSLAAAIKARRSLAEIAQIENTADRLAAELNASYHGKWWLKHHGRYDTRVIFNKRVSAYYDITEARMTASLGLKYDLSNVEWQQLRNALSAGSVGMDLDLALKETGHMLVTLKDGRQMLMSEFQKDARLGQEMIKEVSGMVIRLKNGRRASMSEFQRDAQQAFSLHYENLTGVSARRSELNITTHVHSEAFTDAALLEKQIDWNKIDKKNLHTIGEVTAFKGQHAANQDVSLFTAMQETCRQASKDIDSKLLAYLKLRAGSAKTPAEQAEFLDQVRFWEDMGARFKHIGTQEVDPMKIWQQNNEIRRLTGGRSIFDVVENMKGHLETAVKFRK